MLNSLTADILEALSPANGIPVIITVGNTMRSDDGIGPYIASKLETVKRLKVINASYTPENIIDEVCELSPERIVFIDAADFGGNPGEARMVDRDHIPETTLSTHVIPLKIIANLITADTDAVINYIGVQPKSVGFGEGLSKEVHETADEIIKIIKKEFSNA